MNTKPFLVANAITTVLLLVVCFLVNSFTNLKLPIYLYIVTLVFGLMNVLLFNILKKNNDKTPARFVAAFNGTVAIKLFSAIILVVLGLFLFPDFKRETAIGTMLVYTFFTVVFVRYSMKEIRRKKPVIYFTIVNN